jgi:hypothetical protein
MKIWYLVRWGYTSECENLYSVRFPLYEDADLLARTKAMEGFFYQIIKCEVVKKNGE